MVCRQSRDVVVGDVDQVADDIGRVGEAVVGEAVAQSRQRARQQDHHQVSEIRAIETLAYFFHGRIITSRCFDQ